MKIISHRGYLDGPDESRENNPDAIIECIQRGFDCEIDIRYVNGQLYLGHDSPHTSISEAFLTEFSKSLWIHSKTLESIPYLMSKPYQWFWHESDKLTLTSHGNLWCFPGNYIINSYTVMIGKSLPPLDKNLSGICTDYPNWMQKWI